MRLPRAIKGGLLGIAAYAATIVLRVPEWLSWLPGDPFRPLFQWLAFALDVNWQPIYWGLLAGIIPNVLGWFLLGAAVIMLVKKENKKKEYLRTSASRRIRR